MTASQRKKAAAIRVRPVTGATWIRGKAQPGDFASILQAGQEIL
jgi:hypothetical protein